MNYICKIPSPIGQITAASDGENITGLWFEGQKYYGAGLAVGATEKILPVFDILRKWLDIYFAGKEPDFLPPLSHAGSGFRQAVGDIMLKIPYGKTITYGDIAKQLKKPARAVGGAVGHNPISILVPCHRVVGGSGKLTGYAGGVEKKIKLLELEGIIASLRMK